jgi:hypothetical protein
MKKDQRISVTLEIKNDAGKVISKIDNKEGKIIGPADAYKSAYYVWFDGGINSEAISTKYITKI